MKAQFLYYKYCCNHGNGSGGLVIDTLQVNPERLTAPKCPVCGTRMEIWIDVTERAVSSSVTSHS